MLNAADLCVTAAKGGFFSYIAGTAAAMTEHLKKPDGTLVSGENSSSQCSTGIRIVNYKNDLPMGKGLSSSAAVCVLVAKCFNEVR